MQCMFGSQLHVKCLQKLEVFGGKITKKITKDEIRIPSNVLFFSCIFLTAETVLPIYFCVDMETLHMPESRQLPLDKGIFRTEHRGLTALSAGSPQWSFPLGEFSEGCRNAASPAVATTGGRSAILVPHDEWPRGFLLLAVEISVCKASAISETTASFLLKLLSALCFSWCSFSFPKQHVRLLTSFASEKSNVICHWQTAWRNGFRLIFCLIGLLRHSKLINKATPTYCVFPDLSSFH